MNNPVKIGRATLYNADCMELMAQYPDKYFELAIVDPPYGIDVNKMMLGSGKYKTDKLWDSAVPPVFYFEELKRVSKNQIIWGANYMVCEIRSNSMGWIYWDKENGSSDFSDGELAYSSFNRALRSFKFHLSKERGDRFHPTQKPVKLYEWLLTNYAKQGDKILDTHLGSMSSVIACLNMGYEIVGSELDKDYFDAGIKRVEQSQKQSTLFESAPSNQVYQQVDLMYQNDL
jgi:site-specific DNA-methyltransferase (adenine-specific)